MKQKTLYRRTALEAIFTTLILWCGLCGLPQAIPDLFLPHQAFAGDIIHESPAAISSPSSTITDFSSLILPPQGETDSLSTPALLLTEKHSSENVHENLGVLENERILKLFDTVAQTFETLDFNDDDDDTGEERVKNAPTIFYSCDIPFMGTVVIDSSDLWSVATITWTLGTDYYAYTRWIEICEQEIITFLYEHADELVALSSPLSDQDLYKKLHTTLSSSIFLATKKIIAAHTAIAIITAICHNKPSQSIIDDIYEFFTSHKHCNLSSLLTKHPLLATMTSIVEGTWSDTLRLYGEDLGFIEPGWDAHSIISVKMAIFYTLWHSAQNNILAHHILAHISTKYAPTFAQWNVVKKNISTQEHQSQIQQALHLLVKQYLMPHNAFAWIRHKISSYNQYNALFNLVPFSWSLFKLWRSSNTPQQESMSPQSS